MTTLHDSLFVSVPGDGGGMTSLTCLLGEAPAGVLGVVVGERRPH